MQVCKLRCRGFADRSQHWLKPACLWIFRPPTHPVTEGLGALTREGQESRTGSLSTTAREAGRCRSGTPARVAAGGSRRGSAKDGPWRVAGPARKWAAGAASARAVFLRLHRTGRLFAWPGPGGASKGGLRLTW